MDTGASCSVIDLKVVKKLKLQIKPLDQKLKIVAANESCMKQLGTVTVTMCMMDYVAECSLIVVEKLFYPVIIGMDIMSQHKFVINIAESHVQVGPYKTTIPLIQYVKSSQLARLDAHIKIPPRTEVLARIRLPNENKSGTFLLEALRPVWQMINRYKTLLVARACIQAENGKACCKIFNLTNEEISLPQNYVIAKIHKLQEEDIVPFDPKTKQELIMSMQSESVQSNNDQDVNGSKTHREKLKILTEMGFQFSKEDLTEEELRQIVDLHYEFRDIFGSDLPGIKDIEYHIDLKPNATLPKSSANYFSPNLRDIVQEQVTEWEQKGIIKKGNYKCSSPLLLVKKKCNCELTLKGQKKDKLTNQGQRSCSHPESFRLVSDFRKINSVLDVSPFIPGNSLDTVTETMFSQSPKVKLFSIYDLSSSYLQINLDEESQRLAGLQVFGDSYIYTRLPFGMAPSSFAFQEVLATILKGLDYLRINCYIDDILLGSSSIPEQMKLTRQVFERCRKYNVRLSTKKAQICKTTVKFLGVLLSPEGIRVDPERYKAIENLSPPTNKQGVASFLAMTNFWRKFIFRYSERSQPLRKLLSKTQPFIFGREQQAAFDDLRTCLRKEPIILTIPQFNLPFCIFSDASNKGSAFILTNEMPDSSHKIIAFGGKGWSKYEEKFHSTRMEMLSIVYACIKCKKFLLPKPFKIFTDNISATFISQMSKSHGPMARLALRLSEFNFTIHHIPGKTCPADYLSRISRPETEVDDLSIPPDSHELILNACSKQVEKSQCDILYEKQACKQFYKQPVDEDKSRQVKINITAALRDEIDLERLLQNNNKDEINSYQNHIKNEPGNIKLGDKLNEISPAPKMRQQRDSGEKPRRPKPKSMNATVMWEPLPRTHELIQSDEQFITTTREKIKNLLQDEEFQKRVENQTKAALELYIDHRTKTGQTKYCMYEDKKQESTRWNVDGERLAKEMIERAEQKQPIATIGRPRQNKKVHFALNADVQIVTEPKYMMGTGHNQPKIHKHCVSEDVEDVHHPQKMFFISPNGMIVEIKQAEANSQKAGAIINIKNPLFSKRTVQTGDDLRKIYGNRLLKECHEYCRRMGTLPPQFFMFTPSGNLGSNIEFILHIGEPKDSWLKDVKQYYVHTLMRAFKRANEVGVKSLILPVDQLEFIEQKTYTSMGQIVIDILNAYENQVDRPTQNNLKIVYITTNSPEQHEKILLDMQRCEKFRRMEKLPMYKFFGRESFLSNFHFAEFTYRGIKYSSVEKYYQAEKCRFAGDRVTYHKIMRSNDPRIIKRLSKTIRGLNHVHWDMIKEAVMNRGVWAKFSQNPQLKNLLLATEDKMLVECNPFDRFYSAGLHKNSPEIDDPSLWKGRNILGNILQEVRHRLKQLQGEICAVQTAAADTHRKPDETETYVAHETPETEIVHKAVRKISAEKWVENLKQCPDFKDLYAYLSDQTLPEDTQEAKRIMMLANDFILEDMILYKVVTLKRRTDKRTCTVRMLLAVPSGPLREELVRKSHIESGHSRVNRLYMTLRQSVYWPKLYAEVTEILSKCEKCLLAHRIAPSPVKLKHPPIPFPGQSLFIDVLYLAESKDPLTQQTMGYALATTDQCSGYTVISPLPDLKATTIVLTLEREWFKYFGKPSKISTDSASNLTARVFENLLQKYEIEHHVTCIFSHRSLSPCERRLRVVNAIIRTLLQNQYRLWVTYLPEIMLALNATVSSVFEVSPAEIFLARPIKLPSLANLPEAAKVKEIENTLLCRAEDNALLIEESQRKMTQSRAKADKYCKGKQPIVFEVNQTVLLYYESCPKFEVLKLNPFYRLAIVTEKLPHDTYRLKDFFTKLEMNGRYSVQRLKLAPGIIYRDDGSKIYTTNYHSPVQEIQSEVNPTEPSLTTDRQGQKLDNGQNLSNNERTRNGHIPLKRRRKTRQKTNKILIKTDQKTEKTRDQPRDRWFQIDKILRRRRMSNGKYQYQVQWTKGKGKEWLPRKNITEVAMQQFTARLRKKRRRH